MLVLMGGAAWLAARLDPLPPPLTGTAHASDGDSLRLGRDRVRLIGIDAPELDQTCWEESGEAWACGRAARDRLAELVADGTSCTGEGHDRYGRVLATCRSGGEDVGGAMVASGLAVAREGYAAEALDARAARRGIWRGRFIDPRQWRDEGPVEAPPGDMLQLWDWFRELTGATTLR